MTKGPYELVLQMAAIFNELAIPYALGGSVASSMLGEPRSTVDVDFAVVLTEAGKDRFLDRVGADFYVPTNAARDAIRDHSSFNLLDTAHALKVDVFVLGDGLLDRMQIERRVLRTLPGSSESIWVSSAEDQVLRKLDWYRQGDGVSDRQWRDVVSILRIHRETLDHAYLRTCTDELGLADLLHRADSDARPPT